MPPKKRELEEGGSSGGTPSSQAPALKKRCRSFDLEIRGCRHLQELAAAVKDPLGGYNFSLGTTGPSDMCQYVSPEDACLRHQADTNNCAGLNDAGIEMPFWPGNGPLDESTSAHINMTFNATATYNHWCSRVRSGEHGEAGASALAPQQYCLAGIGLCSWQPSTKPRKHALVWVFLIEDGHGAAYQS
ncbi:hypothetical protein PAHAL_3G458900 [Panicum hallii]|uniref:Uncharacterized protein n=1 Tax=Panicum hallii TaxID=206008 RepID=A0A2T8KLH1_9POAL|nr:uncharacterized protein LOC112887389 isoform X2 [Panicum hallii]PVH63037.1 hypothetical protein PAHAL_3G458900 [Panicum hallii]